MGNPKSIEPHRWKKGESGNPEGGRLHDPLMRQIRRMTREDIIEVGTLLLEENFAELQRIVSDPNTKALKMMLASVAGRAITNGDAKAMSLLLEQIVGKPKQYVTFGGGVGVVHYTPQQIKEMCQLGLEGIEEIV